MDVPEERKRQERKRLLRRSLDRYQRRLGQDLELHRSAPSPEAVERLASGDRSGIEILALACSLYAPQAVE
ncbi:hypothetical protein WMF28_33535 [Sorangium sp. So ce590]|uniref:hypothetical protein n=1 Tax=Sorangium sp. So ce590 TaxID=3133317 RepID=UPI003F639A59